MVCKEESVELKQHLDARKIFVGLYLLAFVIYLVIGLQPADATSYEVSAKLLIPQIGLDTDVTELALDGDHLNTPETIAGSYSQAEHKTLLIGHSTTVFENLNQVELGDLINYDGTQYKVKKISLMSKARIDMGDLLAPAEKDTIVIMTCAGELLENGDATHRLILTAVKL